MTSGPISEQVTERIARAAQREGRRPEDVLLIAVSKTVDVERIRQAVAAGVRALGENRVQEAKEKVAVLGRPVPWHLIGHLQTNKVRDALALFDVIHSIDRLELARECDRRAAAAGRVVNALLEVNVAGEASKGGFAPGEVTAALEAVAKLDHLKVGGLMAIPPAVERAEDARAWFRELRALAERHGLKELSMGMSADFEVAIEEAPPWSGLAPPSSAPDRLVRRREARRESQGQDDRVRGGRVDGRGPHEGHRGGGPGRRRRRARLRPAGRADGRAEPALRDPLG
jgi:pyridoxal phosphate enzyme (YggS family)